MGSYRPNAFGLYDMHGNVYEWVTDWYDSGYYGKSVRLDPTGPATGNTRVVRGGGWSNAPKPCRCAYRTPMTPTNRTSHVGFRVVMRLKK